MTRDGGGGTVSEPPKDLAEAAQRIQDYVNAYIEEYEFAGLPLTDRERLLIEDTINRLVADYEFIARVAEARRLLLEIVP
jgi:hypothetical protein